MSDSDEEHIRRLIAAIINETIGRYTIRVLLTVLGLAGTIAISAFYIGIQISSLNNTIERTVLNDAAQDRRIALVEAKTANPLTRWTLNMMSGWSALLARQNPTLTVPDPRPVRDAYIHEITP
jgi:hypothetical protein